MIRLFAKVHVLRSHEIECPIEVAKPGQAFHTCSAELENFTFGATVTFRSISIRQKLKIPTQFLKNWKPLRMQLKTTLNQLYR